MFETFAKVAPALAVLFGLAAIVMVGAPGPTYKFDMISLGMVFDLLKFGLLAGAIATAFGVLGLVGRLSTGAGSYTSSFLGVILGVGAALLVLNFMQAARAVPPIHDITTDTDNPPAFVAVLSLREGAMNPADYVGDNLVGESGQTVAEAQHQAYPNIQPLFLDTEAGFAFTEAISTVQGLGWELVEANTDEGRIEAVATTFWYGFQDDVVIRIKAQPDGTTRVDVRSKSRVGVSDVGANAARIQAFMDALSVRTGG